MSRNPHQVTKDFERALCEYTGAPYAVAVNSCTMALLLAVAWHLREPNAWLEQARQIMREEDSTLPDFRMKVKVEIPKRTYVSVPMSIIHAGGRPTFRDEEWRGAYQLSPLPIWDSARFLTAGMYDQLYPWECASIGNMDQSPIRKNAMLCLSFHWSKTLGIEQGGAIIHNDYDADAWLRRARFDGRTEGIPPSLDEFRQIGWHCYMSPEVAAAGLVRLSFLPKVNKPLPNDEYPDLSTMEIFR